MTDENRMNHRSDPLARARFSGSSIVAAMVLAVGLWGCSAVEDVEDFDDEAAESSGDADDQGDAGFRMLQDSCGDDDHDGEGNDSGLPPPPPTGCDGSQWCRIWENEQECKQWCDDQACWNNGNNCDWAWRTQCRNDCESCDCPS